MSANAKQISTSKRTLFNYNLTQRQDAVLNCLVPSSVLLLVFMFLFASDSALVFRHFKDNNPIWASLTIFFMYLPSLFSFILTISTWELWPKRYGCDTMNTNWFLLKTLEHLFYPVWAMWRYAERIFWSIEAVTSKNEDSFTEAWSMVSAPRTIELFFFLQAFLHSLPQMLLQLNILMRQKYDIEKQTADAQVLSFVFNLTKLAITVAFYQRFRSQKLAGKQYPWDKPYKKIQVEPKVEVAKEGAPESSFLREVIDDTPKDDAQVLDLYEEDADDTASITSSHFYEQPSPQPKSPLTEIIALRETSIVDGPKRTVFSEISKPDFNVQRVITIKGLQEDDIAGKLVSFIWWFIFLLARILAITAFFFFYHKETIILLVVHFVIVIGVLLYDAKTDNVTRAKALFFVFIGLIYIFCIIEYKIKFKKTKFIYIAYFGIVLFQNLVMCCVWWFNDVDELQSEYWFRFIFYVVISGSIVSMFTMFFYLFINKPKKVLVS